MNKGNNEMNNTRDRVCTHGLPATGTGTGQVQVQKSQPARKPVPTVWVWVLMGTGTGMAKSTCRLPMHGVQFTTKGRLMQDYWKLNDSMRKNRYLLPLIGESINGLKKSKVLLKMDVWV
jgi:hypothetical protein